MPELETKSGSAPLTQKRVILNNTNSIPKIDSLEKMDETMEEEKISPPINVARQPLKVDLNNKIPLNDNIRKPEKTSGSGAKIVIWVVIVIVLAIAAYLGLKSVLNGPVNDNDDNDNITVTVAPVVDFISQIVKDRVLSDDEADLKQSFTLFNNSSQEIGIDSTGTFAISDIFVQKYTSFTRLGVQVSILTGEDSLPKVTSTYDQDVNEITLKFPSTVTELDIPFDTEITVGTENVDSIIRVDTDNSGFEEFLIKLNAPTTYILQVSSESDTPIVYLDIKENDVLPTPVYTIIVSPEVSSAVTPKPTAGLSTTPAVTSAGDVLENLYSKNAQELHNGLTTNTASFNRFQYFDTSLEFTWKAEILTGTGGKMPSVSASIDGNVVTV
jgi:hypothetical protein